MDYFYKNSLVYSCGKFNHYLNVTTLTFNSPRDRFCNIPLLILHSTLKITINLGFMGRRGSTGNYQLKGTWSFNKLVIILIKSNFF